MLAGTVFGVSAVETTFEPATLDVVYELFREVPERQLQAVDALDSKAAQLLAAGSVVLGFTAVGAGEVWPPFVAAALVAYGGLAWQALGALRPRPWRAWRDPWGTWSAVWELPPAEAKYALLARLRDDVPANAGWIKEKGRHVRLALRWLAGEVLLVGAGVVLAAL